jgi:hypothetical protein
VTLRHIAEKTEILNDTAMKTSEPARDIKLRERLGETSAGVS